MDKCNICESSDLSRLYESKDVALSSVNSQFESKLVVKFCKNCSHILTMPPVNMEQFYADEYRISIDSEEEDQLISISGSDAIYRTGLQAQLLKKYIDLSKCKKIIDYGGAKGTTLKRVLKEYEHIAPYIFDVSNNYEKYWEGVFPKENRSIFNLPESWNNCFDVATSFFVLEHVEDLDTALRNVKKILKRDGYYFIIVPNVLANIADFVVADHINHFTQNSLEFCFNKYGFVIERFDDKTNPSWFIVVAKNVGTNFQMKSTDHSPILEQASKIADQWANLNNKIIEVKKNLKDRNSVAIYGAGFYGTYIAKILGFDNFNCFIDKNEFLQQKLHYSKAVVDPTNIANSITDVIVALNPTVAVNAMNSIDCWNDKKINFYYPLQA